MLKIDYHLGSPVWKGVDKFSKEEKIYQLECAELLIKRHPEAFKQHYYKELPFCIFSRDSPQATIYQNRLLAQQAWQSNLREKKGLFLIEFDYGPMWVQIPSRI